MVYTVCSVLPCGALHILIPELRTIVALISREALITRYGKRKGKTPRNTAILPYRREKYQNYIWSFFPLRCGSTLRENGQTIKKLNWYPKGYFIPEVKCSIYITHIRKLQYCCSPLRHSNSSGINRINTHSLCDHILYWQEKSWKFPSFKRLPTCWKVKL